jgi:hypothetical protein
MCDIQVPDFVSQGRVGLRPKPKYADKRHHGISGRDLWLKFIKLFLPYFRLDIP